MYSCNFTERTAALAILSSPESNMVFIPWSIDKLQMLKYSGRSEKKRGALREEGKENMKHRHL